MSASEVEELLATVRESNPGEPEFVQAVAEVAESVLPMIEEHPQYADARVFERLLEPDRILQFRVCWEDDQGEIQVNRAWRVQWSNALGPYKGGLRFHPAVNVGTLKFLAFEQTFKNALTGLPLGGAKGGSNFDPRGRSDREVMRFCQAFMACLHRHIGEDTDVPAGDIGVGAREIGYLFGGYRRMHDRVGAVLTGKGLGHGGSPVRKEATGYGTVYFAEHMLARIGEGLEGKRAVVSGSGNVALYCAQKLIERGATVLAMSDSSGFVVDSEGIDAQKLEFLRELKEQRRGRIHEYADRFSSGVFAAGKRPWQVPCDLAFPCATQNELDRRDAFSLIENGVRLVAEGANMPTTPDAVRLLQQAKVLYAPGKASNAGGVAVSGLEQSQNAMRMTWSESEVERRLAEIMQRIHGECTRYGDTGEPMVDYVRGANLAGFARVADAMCAHGVL